MDYGLWNWIDIVERVVAAIYWGIFQGERKGVGEEGIDGRMFKHF